MPDKKLTDSEIIKEIQGIKESMKRHIDLTNEMGQDLLRIDEEYTGGSKVWLTTDYFQKVVKHFSHSNYLVKCLELVFEYINRLQAENERLETENKCYAELEQGCYVSGYKKIEAEAYKEFAERLKVDLRTGETIMDKSIRDIIDNLLKEMVGEDNV